MAPTNAPSRPNVEFHTLPHADGSASYEFRGFSIVCTANGPIEAQRRDELPEEAVLEVILRPATGPGAPRDRLLESLLHRTLLPLLHTKAHPRSLVQVTLQILATPASEYSVSPPAQSDSVLPALPHLLHAAIIALLDGNIPLLGFAGAALLAVVAEGEMEVDGGRVVVWPSVEELRDAQSVHVIGFDSGGGLLLVESEGEFDLEQWDKVVTTARTVCTGVGGVGARKKGTNDQGILGVFRVLVGQNIVDMTSWRHGS